MPVPAVRRPRTPRTDSEHSVEQHSARRGQRGLLRPGRRRGGGGVRVGRLVHADDRGLPPKGVPRALRVLQSGPPRHGRHRPLSSDAPPQHSRWCVLCANSTLLHNSIHWVVCDSANSWITSASSSFSAVAVRDEMTNEGWPTQIFHVSANFSILESIREYIFQFNIGCRGIELRGSWKIY